MWRFLKSIPRVARWNLNSARPTPQSVCQEEDRETCLHVAAENICEVTEQKICQPVKLRYLRDEKNFSYDQDHDESQDPEKDSWFQKWLDNFLRSYHGTQAYSVQEAVGWGSVLLLGSQLFHCRSHKWEAKQEKLCPVRLLYRFAVAMPGTETQLRRHILPPTPGQAAANESEGENLSLSASEPSRVEESTSSVGGQQHHFAKAEKEWNRLTRLHDSMIKNSLAYTKAKYGDFSEAVKLWKSASTLGYAKSHFNLGLCYELGKNVKKNFPKAVEHYQSAADIGHAKAQYNLAILYLQGKGHLECDVEKAIDLLQAAAENGLPRAQTELGVLYTEEDRKDMEKAASFFKMAADHEDISAQHYLGICYERGWGVEENTCCAAQLYKKASDGGHAQASYSLGVFFENGLGGLPKDAKAALELYQASLNQGNASAEIDVERLERKLEDKTGDGVTYTQPCEDALTNPKCTLMGSASFHALTDYLQRHLQHFCFSDTDSILSCHFADMHLPPMDKTIHTLHDDEKEGKVKFYLGESEEDEVGSGACVMGDTELTYWRNDSRDSGFANGSRSCSFNDINHLQEAESDLRMASCS